MTAEGTVSVLLVAAGETDDRLAQAAGSVAAQRDARVSELVVAVPPSEVSRTAAALAQIALRVVVIGNPGGRRSPGLNRALTHASGDFVCRVDARSFLPERYLARCARRLAAMPGVGVVGGAQVPRPGSPGPRAQGIARALSNPWAMGGAGYRTGRPGPSDTVYLGFFRRTELEAIGGWDERLDANEDYDLCQRYLAKGLVVWVEAGVAVDYEARTTYGQLAAQYYAFGLSKVAYWKSTGRGPVVRQIVPIVAATVTTALGAAVLIRRPRGVPAFLLLAAAGLAAVDELGTREGARPKVRAAAGMAYGTVWSAWLTGLLAGWVRPRSS